MGDGGRCKAVLYVLMHVNSGGPRLPVEIKQRAVHYWFNVSSICKTSWVKTFSWIGCVGLFGLQIWTIFKGGKDVQL